MPHVRVALRWGNAYGAVRHCDARQCYHSSAPVLEPDLGSDVILSLDLDLDLNSISQVDFVAWLQLGLLAFHFRLCVDSI